jgi:putative ubiquitin-RnfH superfamily antitoxin RatB of RatAB toxin-antitoxin module
MPVSVSLVYSPAPRTVREAELVLEAGTTVGQALRASGWLEELPASERHTLEVGVWGRKVALSRVLREGDRLELYRALTVDPKVARRERFTRQGARTAGLFAKRRAGAKAGY